MRAITITKHGGPDVLAVIESDDPEPAAGEVRVSVRACGLNFAELMARQGLYPDAPPPPCVVGYEAAGVVDKLGDGVDDLDVGDRVMLAVKFGAHADVVCTDRSQVYKIADEMSFEEAAAIPVNYLTAYHMLFEVAHVRPGESVLIHMAAGGVGIAALQLCQSVGDITTFGTASPGKHDVIREQGCTHPIDYRSKDYSEEVRRLTDNVGVDIVLDALGGKDWRHGYDLLKPVGRLVAFGFANMASGEKRSIFNMGKQLSSALKWTWTPMSLMDDNKSIAGVNMGHLWDQKELLAREMEALLALWDEGHIKPRIDSTFAFDDAAAAHQRIHDRKNVGKVILTP